MLLTTGSGTRLTKKRRRFANLQSRLAAFEADVEARGVRLSIGSRQIRVQAVSSCEERLHHIHDKWLPDWRDARTDEFSVKSSRDKAAECQLRVPTVADDGALTLRLRKQVEINDVAPKREVRSVGQFIHPGQRLGQAAAAMDIGERHVRVRPHAGQGMDPSVVLPDLQIQRQGARQGPPPAPCSEFPPNAQLHCRSDIPVIVAKRKRQGHWIVLGAPDRQH